MDNYHIAQQQWIRRQAQSLDRATIGQLLTLLSMVGARSVAEVGRRTAKSKSLSDAGVNSRQKLARLEAALGVGKLTERVGKYTRLTPAGERVAGEARLFLQELHAIHRRKAPVPTWIIGAGDAWLHSLIIPALGDLANRHPEWRWEVRNLRAADIRAGLRDGVLHFGFIREKELDAESDFSVGTRVYQESYRIIVGKAADAPKGAKELVHWALEQKRPLAQQGSTWKAFREILSREVGMEKALAELVPQIICESHPQAIMAVEAGNSWCMVPSGLGRNLSAGCRSALLKAGAEPDAVCLVSYSRALGKHSDNGRATEALIHAIRDASRVL